MQLGLSLGPTNTPSLSKGVSDAVADILGASGADYAEFDFTAPARLFQDDAGTVPVTATGQTIGRANARQRAPHYAQRSAPSFRPTYQGAGARFDGADDSMASDWLASAAENCIVALVDVPVSFAINQFVAGSLQSTRCLAIGFGTSGQARFRAGDASVNAGGDLRGTTTMVAVTNSGSAVRAFAGDQMIHEAAQSGTVDTALPLWLGALNSGGAVSYFGGTLRRIAFGHRYLTLAQYLAIRSQWLAA